MNAPRALEQETRGGLAPRTAGQAGEDRFRALIELGADAIVVLSERGRVLHVNPAAERLFGRPRAELAGSVLGLPLAPAGRAEIQVLGAEARPTLCELSLIESAWSGAPALLATLRDISEKASTEAALREIQERYDLAARAANDGLWDWDLLAETVDFSPRGKAMLGAEDDEEGAVGGREGHAGE